MYDDEFEGQGGSYLMGKDGKRTRVEEPTADHPDGNRARAAEEAAPQPLSRSDKPISAALPSVKSQPPTTIEQGA